MSRQRRLFVTVAAASLLLAKMPCVADSFAQIGSKQFRDQEGTGMHFSASEHYQVLMDGLPRKDKVLMSSFTEAAEGRNWLKIQALWAGYSGTAYPVFCAAMQAALICGKYEEAAHIHRKLWNITPRPKVSIIYSIGMKIFGHLGQGEQVEALWREAQERDVVDKFVAGNRIDAAAELGDITGAADGLDYMIQNGYEVTVIQFNSAINACKSSQSASHRAANYLYQTMIERKLEPTTATFGALIGSHKHAPLATVQQAWATMEEYGVSPNQIIAESYLTALLGRLPDGHWGPKKLLPEIQKRDAERQEAAKAALKILKERKVPFTGLCRAIDKAFRLEG